MYLLCITILRILFCWLSISSTPRVKIQSKWTFLHVGVCNDNTRLELAAFYVPAVPQNILCFEAVRNGGGTLIRNMKCPSITLQSYSTCRLASNHNLRSRVSPFVYFFSQQASNLSPHPLSNAYPSPRDLPPETHYTPQISDFNYDNVEWTPRYDWRLRAPAARRRKQEPPTNPGIDTQQRKYIKRIIPPQMDVQIVEPFYEQIQLYKKQFVLLHDLSSHTLNLP